MNSILLQVFLSVNLQDFPILLPHKKQIVRYYLLFRPFLNYFYTKNDHYMFLTSSGRSIQLRCSILFPLSVKDYYFTAKCPCQYIAAFADFFREVQTILGSHTGLEHISPAAINFRIFSRGKA